MIEVKGVSYAYPGAASFTIDDLSLTIPEGEFLVVCGPSGAGKSTFLRLLNGLVPHFYGGRFAGDVRVWGRSTRAHQPRDLADAVGFVFQDPEAQFVVDVVEDEIVFAMENLGVAPPVMRRRVEEVLDQLGIAHLRRRRVSSLSGGEQQRVAIAAVLAAQPRALVLDEPTSQLDPHAAEEVLSALQKLNDDLGLTIVLCEHRLERVVQYADRLLYFSGPGDRETGRLGDKETGRQGDRETGRLGDKETGRPGEALPLSPSPPLPLSPPAPLSPAPPPSSLHAARSLPVVGPPREVLAHVPLAPPLARLGRALGWSPLPLTIKEGRRFVRERAAGEDGVHAAAPAEVASPPPPSVALSGVHFAYGEREALYDLSLTGRPGEVLALMGRNGSGKTTLLKLLIGLLRPQHGTVSVLGHDVSTMAVEDVAALVGYVPQNPRSLLFHDTLRDELAFTLKGRKVGDGRPEAGGNGSSTAIDRTLELLGLAHLAEAYPRDLSGGEAQRAALAAILVGDPQVILLDEPTRGLDYQAKDRLGRALRQLAAQGRTVILATHDVELVAAAADRVALLGDGELVVEGPVREVLGESLIFSSQVAKLFPGRGWLTPEDVVEAPGRRAML